MNAVDRFREVYARSQAAPARRPERKREVSEVVVEAAPLVGRLAGLVERGRHPEAAAPSQAGGAVGGAMRQINEAIKDKNLDRFVRHAAPIADEAIPLVSDIVDFVRGKRPTLPAPAPAPYGYPSHPAPMPPQGPVPQAIQGLATLVGALSGLFK